MWDRSSNNRKCPDDCDAKYLYRRDIYCDLTIKSSGKPITYKINYFDVHPDCGDYLQIGDSVKCMTVIL
ncbi:Oidioi.mRNA.OKI2018_I69.PAR.g9562.t1.cds [Oikopleura dioica]|uniref:Oidioi.mRNA.OKI2018_I69.PAR.g9562.t1.cds n=1 Tax=Oikopleura dioica TaxID=34765 RepID=A0ABN7RQE8_OIKDI|nr:Oidioi.mRNA.OKI2018_I69.PAR.g9562.t1.cds [Oikopleura dioica]